MANPKKSQAKTKKYAKSKSAKIKVNIQFLSITRKGHLPNAPNMKSIILVHYLDNITQIGQ